MVCPRIGSIYACFMVKTDLMVFRFMLNETFFEIKKMRNQN